MNAFGRFPQGGYSYQLRNNAASARELLALPAHRPILEFSGLLDQAEPFLEMVFYGGGDNAP